MAEAKEADYGPLEFPSNVEVNDNVPSEEKIAKVADFPVLDVDGKKVPFRSLYEGANGEKKNHKVLVIFVRHFYCGVRQLNHPRVTQATILQRTSMLTYRRRIVRISWSISAKAFPLPRS
jgi:hypothetical protein